MSEDKMMGWELSRSGEWKHVVLPMSNVVQGEGETFDSYMRRFGYVEMSTFFESYVLMSLTIYESVDRSAPYRHLVCAEKNGEGVEWFACKELPDLIELGAKLYPLWQMSHSYFLKETRDDDFMKKLFHALHGHSLISSCWECDPVHMERVQRLTQERDAAKR